MSKFEKIKDKIMRKPTVNDLMPNEIKNFLEHYGFILKRVRGDHFIYIYPDKSEIVLNIPMHKPVKEAYIDHIRNAIILIEED